MPALLHSWYTREAAVEAFGLPSSVEWYCEEQFARLPDVVLGFFTVGSQPASAQSPSPSRIIWKPAVLEGPLALDTGSLWTDDDPGAPDRMPWFPRPVRELGEDDHHLFLRAAGDSEFVYAGPAGLGTIGDGRGGREAGFYLEMRLPHEVWIRIGGYSGWRIEVNHQETIIAPGDRTALETLLRKLGEGELGHLTMTRYEEDSLHLYLNPDRGWLMYLRHPSDSGLYTRDTAATNPRAEVFFECDCGIDLETTMNRTLSREHALELVREFFRTGLLPQSVPWTEDWD